MCAITLQICAYSDTFVHKHDDLEDHEPYQLEELQALIQGARRHFKYPGWNLNPDGSFWPKEEGWRIMEENWKVLNNTAVKAATSSLGFHLEDNQTWLLPPFFCNLQVQKCTYVHICALGMCTWNVHILTEMCTFRL
jgi:hypothetical protein